MIWEGYSKIRQLEKLGDGWVGGGWWVVFANNKDWQGQSIPNSGLVFPPTLRW